MPLPHFEVLSGAVDGVNTTFTASMAYTSGSTAVFLNGQLKRPHVAGVQDGWVETSPPAGVVTLDEAPRSPNDVVQMFYLDTSPAAQIVQAGPEPLSATIQDISAIDASFEDVADLSAEIVTPQVLDASIDDLSQLAGSMVDVVKLAATLECST